MKATNLVHIIAGLLILLFTFLGFFYSNWFFAGVVFIGLNLFQYGITNWCLLEKILIKFNFAKNK